MLALGSTLGYCRAIEGIAEPKELDRSISGGERSEETVRRLVGGELFMEFAIVRRAGTRSLLRAIGGSGVLIVGLGSRFGLRER